MGEWGGGAQWKCPAGVTYGEQVQGELQVEGGPQIWVQVESRLRRPARWVTAGGKSLGRVVKGYKELKGFENR